MNHHKRLSVLAAAAALTFSHGVWAQEGTPAAEPTPAPAPAAEEESDVPGWFRMDADPLGLQFWAGATHSLGGVDIASDIYVFQGVGGDADATTGALTGVGAQTNGEFDIGPVISLDNLTLTPMIGVNFNFNGQRVNPLIAPQLFTIFSSDPIYFESWIQFFINKGVFHNDEEPNTLYTRNFLLFKVGRDVSVGPQFELTYGLNNAAKIPNDQGEPDKALLSLPVGGAVSLAYGKGATLLMFLGYETVEEAQVKDQDKITGRFTWIYTF
ncbi:MAG: hypothetical protein H6718_02390 [Polyangiaceae bacterium]|nr:hypothetical protein [Polyangiaceae bacterium]MCB9608625.1 hypothetical protein [Polyangiaceae bacterium]